MRLFFLYLLFFVVYLVNGEETNNKKCFLPAGQSITSYGTHSINVNEDFVANNMTNCAEWIGHDGKFGDAIDIKEAVTQEMFTRMFANLTKISRVSAITFLNNELFTSLVFPSLKSIDASLQYIYFLNCPNVTKISFPVLERSLQVNMLDIIGMVSLDAVSIDNLIKKFVGERTTLTGVCDRSNIADVSSLSGCKFLRRMIFAENTNGTVKRNITYVKEELKIVGTQLRNLDFLKLEPLEVKHQSACEIVNNTFCKFDKDSVVKMLEDVYDNCTIENNLDGECACNFTNEEYTVDANFIAEYPDCTEWNNRNGGTRIIMDYTVSQVIFERIVLNLTRITGVSLEIRENEQLKNLTFPKLETFGEEGEDISAEFKYNPNVESISFPELSEASAKIITHGMNSLGKESIDHLNSKFEKKEIKEHGECAFPRPISNVSQLSVCKTVTSLEFAAKIRGKVSSSIGFVRESLLVQGTLLEDLNFLQLHHLDEKNMGECKITDNKFCGNYDEGAIGEVLGRAHAGCILKNNIGNYCVCDFVDEEYIVDEAFLGDFSDCSEWVASGDGVSRLVLKGNWPHAVFVQLFGNLTKISGISFEISENHELTSLEFPKLESFGEDGQEISAEFKFNSKVQSISFPNITKSSAKLITQGLHSLSNESIETLKEKFQSEGISSFGVCHFADEEYIVDETFMGNFSECIEWISLHTSGVSRVVMKGNWTEDKFVHIFGNLTKISGVSFEISENHDLTSLEFPKLKSFGQDGQKLSAEFKFNSKVQSISFPNITKSSAKLITQGLHSLSNESIETLKEKFQSEGISSFGVCHLRENQTFLVDRDFVRDYWKCSQWISNNSTIIIDPDMRKMRFRRSFSKVKKISGISLEIYQNVHFDFLLFPHIESFGDSNFSLTLRHCPRIRNISFPRLPDTNNKNVKITIHGTHEMNKKTVKRLKFAHVKGQCAFKYPISHDSLLYGCRNVTSLNFTPEMIGIVNDPIVYIDKHLIIEGTRLRDIEFLKLTPRRKKNTNKCSIVGNNFCRFNKDEVTKIVLKFYRNCTIGENMNNTYCERYPTPKPYRPRRNLQFDSRGYYIPPKDDGWWRMPMFFACSIVFLSFLCWNCN